MAPATQAASTVLSPAPLAARLAAFLLDCAVGLGFGLLSWLLAWLLLLATSHGGAASPSDTAIYGSLITATLWAPAWGGVTLVSWVRSGSSPGQAAMALRLAVPTGGSPGPLRALFRLVLLGLAALLVALALLLGIGAAAAAAQGTLPAPIGLAAALVVVLAGVDPAFCFITRDRRALHDLAAGTLVVRLA